MEKIKNKITLKEILYLLFCIFDIYILPLILGAFVFKRMIGWGSLSALWPKYIRIWINGYGCFVLMLGAAVYEYFNKKNTLRDGAIWIYIFAVLPHIVLGLISAFVGGLESLTLIDNFLPLIFAGGGIWLGRFLSGQYKGIKQLYLADLLYILGCILIFVVSSVFFYKDILAEEYMLCIGLALLLISSLYGRFSEFEYIQERLLRAVMTVSVIFTVAFILYFCQNKEYASNPFYVFEDFAVYFIKPASTVVVGVAMGYYLRIMRLGGEREAARRDSKRTLIKYTVLAGLILLVPICVELRYYLSKQVYIYDAAGIDMSDAALVTVYDVKSGVGHVSTDKESITKIDGLLRTEKGSAVKNLPCKKADGAYRINVFDKSGAVILYLNMDHRGELSVGNYKNGSNGRYVLVNQYYGKENTKKDEYIDAVKNSEPQTTTEKLEFIENIDGNVFDYYLMQSFFEKYAADRVNAVREATAKKIRTLDYVDFGKVYLPLLCDKDKGIKAEAYSSLMERGAAANYNDIATLVANEKDEKYRFLAITFFGRKIEEFDKDKMYDIFHTEYASANNNTDKLAYACAMLSIGKYSYIKEAEQLLGLIPDTRSYTDVKKIAGDIIEEAHNAPDNDVKEDEPKPEDVFVYPEGSYDDVNLW